MAAVLLLGSRYSPFFSTPHVMTKSRSFKWTRGLSFAVFRRRLCYGLSDGVQNRIDCFWRKPHDRRYKRSTLFVYRREFRRNFCSNSGQKSGRKLSRSELKRILSLARPETRRLAVAVCLLFVSSAVAMSVPFCMGRVLDVIYAAQGRGEMVEKLSFMCKVFVLIFVIGALANFGRIVLIQTSGQKVIRRLREMVFGAVLRQEMAFFDQSRTGELITRLSADTSLVGQALTSNISDGLRSLAQISVGLCMMFYLSPNLAAVILGIVPPIALLSVAYGRFMRSITRKAQDALASSTEVAEEKIGSIRTVKSLGMEDVELNRYGTQIDQVLTIANREALARGVFFGFAGLSGNLVVLAVLWKGGMMMNESQLSVGDLTSFLLYTGYVGFSIGGLSTFYTELMKGVGASSRLWELTDRTPSIRSSGGITLPVSSFHGTIEFQNISFAYPSRPDAPIFNDVTLTLPAGSVTAVVGMSGSGKSTLAALLLRLYDVDTGRILVDGCGVKDLDPTWLRRNIGTVSQEPVLFSTSIAENILYGIDDPDNYDIETIANVAEKANAWSFISSFPDGLQTMVGERGQTLSGGQRQRIAIARALLKDPKILILDEATSALDAESEYVVQEALDRLMSGRTVLTIAHRLSTIKTAHRIVVLDAGMVAELGTYQELMSKPDGIFRKLVDRQTIVSN
ncbi:ATP-binding cassette sub-family B member 10, mitochondrial-like [Corticium candelabrum]|uniref:ATP-binding cassette sub-family B member 10, mitochondrial-like n=1 Tax=Corticium candelabrum TaxID=121492 RepID=UPI002E271258|nr:ATP-binding cassette sub-family B member 10, mitochondrial-like [Corticium candelabrum]